MDARTAATQPPLLHRRRGLHHRRRLRGLSRARRSRQGVERPARPVRSSQLGSRHYSIADLQRVREDQERSLRENLGDAFDAKAASQYLDQISADRLIQRAMLASEAERARPAGQRRGGEAPGAPRLRRTGRRLDGKALRDYAVRRFGSEGRFVQEVRDDILFTKLLDLIDCRRRGLGRRGARRGPDAARGGRASATSRSTSRSRRRGSSRTTRPSRRSCATEDERVRRFYDEHTERFQLPRAGPRPPRPDRGSRRTPPRTRSPMRRAASRRRSPASRAGRTSPRSPARSARTRAPRSAAAISASSGAARWCPRSKRSPSTRRTARPAAWCAPTSAST